MSQSQNVSLNMLGSNPTTTLIVTSIGMAAIVGSALAFEHIGGYVPCALCLEQRNPYYLGLPFVVVGSVVSLNNGPIHWVRGFHLIGILCLIATAVLGAYHAGVEWQFWEGPAGCSASITAENSDAGSLLSSLSETKPPSCTDAAGRFLGLSFAGWNVVAASALAIYSWRGLTSKNT